MNSKASKKLLHLPISTPKGIIHWDGGMEMIKWRIAKRKLMFVRKMMKADCDRIRNQICENLRRD